MADTPNHAPATTEAHTLTIKCTDEEWASLRAVLTAGPDGTEQPMYVRASEHVLTLLYPVDTTEQAGEDTTPEDTTPPLTRTNSKVGCPECSCLGGWPGGQGGREDGCPMCGHPAHDSATDAV